MNADTGGRHHHLAGDGRSRRGRDGGSVGKCHVVRDGTVIDDGHRVATGRSHLGHGGLEAHVEGGDRDLADDRVRVHGCRGGGRPSRAAGRLHGTGRGARAAERQGGEQERGHEQRRPAAEGEEEDEWSREHHVRAPRMWTRNAAPPDKGYVVTQDYRRGPLAIGKEVTFLRVGWLPRRQPASFLTVPVNFRRYPRSHD